LAQTLVDLGDIELELGDGLVEMVHLAVSLIDFLDKSRYSIYFQGVEMLQMGGLFLFESKLFL
jgi:hypothetical protein